MIPSLPKAHRRTGLAILSFSGGQNLPESLGEPGVCSPGKFKKVCHFLRFEVGFYMDGASVE